MSKIENISMALSVGTGTYAIANLQDILGVIILTLSILNIVWNMIYRIYNHIKNKRLDKISEEIENARKELTELEEDNNNE